MNAPHEAIFVLPADQSGQPSPATVTLLMKHAINKGYLTGCFAIDVSTIASPELQRQPNELSSAGTLAALRLQVDELRKSLPGQGIATPQMIMRDLETIPATYIMKRGDFLSPIPRVDHCCLGSRESSRHPVSNPAAEVGLNSRSGLCRAKIR